MPESFRTKATVEEGIVLQDGHANVVIMDYQPGNGTRYELIFTRIPYTPNRAYILGEWATRGAVWMVYLKNIQTKRNPIFVETGNHPLDWRDVWSSMDGFGISQNDAVCLAEVIAHVTGRPCKSAEEMTKDVMGTLRAHEEQLRRKLEG